MKKLNVIIVEDEAGAAHSLAFLLNEIEAEICVVAVLTSVEETVSWLTNNEIPDLAFFDIQLEDGLSFEVFKNYNIEFPVIFTTAFDQYAIDAFKVNSIDYLLKPIKESDLIFSLNKFESLNKNKINAQLIESLLGSVSNSKETTTLLIHYREKLIPVSTIDFAYFFIEGNLIHGYTFNQKLYPIEFTLDELEKQLNNKQFFRANRQYIINRKSILDMEYYFNGRLSLNVNPTSKEAILISKARVPVFKEWLKQ